MYKYQTLAQYVAKTPQIKNRIEKALHRGSTGKKAGMWVARRTIVGLLASKFPKRFNDLGLRKSWQKVAEEVVAV